jgi:hypothetical protein
MLLEISSVEAEVRVKHLNALSISGHGILSKAHQRVTMDDKIQGFL